MAIKFPKIKNPIGKFLKGENEWQKKLEQNIFGQELESWIDNIIDYSPIGDKGLSPTAMYNYAIGQEGEGDPAQLGRPNTNQYGYPNNPNTYVDQNQALENAGINKNLFYGGGMGAGGMSTDLEKPEPQSDPMKELLQMAILFYTLKKIGAPANKPITIINKQ